jgi:hypothetical protein
MPQPARICHEFKKKNEALERIFERLLRLPAQKQAKAQIGPDSTPN